jgi:hypothetical protein
MAKEPLIFHIRNDKGSVTFAVRAFDARNLAVGYAVTHKGDNFCKKIGRTIAENRANHILNNPEKNSSRSITNESRILPHIVRKNIVNILQRSKELLKMESNSIYCVTWADSRSKRTPTDKLGLVQLELNENVAKEESSL